MIVLLSLLLSVQVTAATPATATDSAALQAALESVRDSMGIRGVAAAVIRSDGSLWTGVAGESFPGEPITRATVFDAGSIGKMYTAALVLALNRADSLPLDEPVARWLPDVPNAGRVTPRMLLTHTSGWSDAWANRAMVGRLVAAPLHRWTMQDILDSTPPPVAEPGERWAYSSSGYHALGRIVEIVSDESFGSLLRGRVLDRRQFTRTVHGAFEEPVEPVAHAWLDVNSDGTPEDFTALLPATSWRTAAGPAGSILTTAEELARFTRDFVSQVPDDHWVARPDGNRHGLGVLRIELDGRNLVGHRGNAAGYSAEAWQLPGEGVTIAVLTNAHAIQVTPISRQLLQILLDSAGQKR